jgi:uncharacterized protein (TIGR02145 family)
VAVRPRKGSAAVCSRCHLPAPGYDQLTEGRFEFIPLWGFLVFLLYTMRRGDCHGKRRRRPFAPPGEGLGAGIRFVDRRLVRRAVRACKMVHYAVKVCMTRIKEQTKPIRFISVSLALSAAFLSVSASLQRLSAQDRKASGTSYPSKRMADGKQWMTRNLDVQTVPSYCYERAEENCRRYGRLYTWELASRACLSLGGGWRLPTDNEWRQLAKAYGGVSEDSEDKGKAAYKALVAGGSAGFRALLGGGRSEDGQYARLEAHGFYWTASEIDSANGWYYNFGRGGLALHRQNGGEKPRAFSVRCVRE